MGSTRIDKNPPGASFRARLNADWAAGTAGTVVGVGLNASGKVVAGAGTSGLKGVVCLTRAMKAGEVVDVFRPGAELADFTTLADGSTAVTAGTNYYADATDGEVTATDTGVYIGFTVEIDGRNRLVLDGPTAPPEV